MNFIYKYEFSLSQQHLRTHRCILSHVATDAIVLKHQAISIFTIAEQPLFGPILCRKVTAKRNKSRYYQLKLHHEQLHRCIKVKKNHKYNYKKQLMNVSLKTRHGLYESWSVRPRGIQRFISRTAAKQSHVNGQVMIMKLIGVVSMLAQNIP